MPNPLGQVRLFRRRGKKIWLPVWKDINGDSVTTSNGLIPVKQYWEPVNVAVLHAVIYKTITDAEYYAQFNSLNSTAWRSFPQYHAWVAEIHTDERNIAADNGANQTASDVHYVVWGTDRHGGWRFTQPDVSYHYLDSGNYKAFTAGGIPYLGSLNSSGGKAAPGSGGKPPLIVKEHDTKSTIDFSTALGF